MRDLRAIPYFGRNYVGINSYLSLFAVIAVLVRVYRVGKRTTFRERVRELKLSNSDPS